MNIIKYLSKDLKDIVPNERFKHHFFHMGQTFVNQVIIGGFIYYFTEFKYIFLILSILQFIIYLGVESYQLGYKLKYWSKDSTADMWGFSAHWLITIYAFNPIIGFICVPIYLSIYLLTVILKWNRP